MSDMEFYARYFPVGLKVGVGIPLPNAEVFRDWAIIHSIDEDLVSLQISRDMLPEGVSLHYGQIFELRGGKENSGYCCRAIVVSEGDARELLLRLIGEIVSDELREFYRIDAFLPIKYFVSQEQHVDHLHQQWEERRTRRQLQELEQQDHRWSDGGPPHKEHRSKKHRQESSSPDNQAQASEQHTAEEQLKNSWDSVIPLAANISGGGLRVITHQHFEYGDYILLEIMVPIPQRIVDAVGRIVFANHNYAAGSDREYYNTGVQFVYIDERDRDAIVSYISTIQLKRIRQLRERYLFRSALADNDQSDTAASLGIGRKSTRMISALLLLVLLALLMNFFWHYSQGHPKGDIQRMFEDSVKKYRDPAQ